ncbi:hypothetical protein LMJ41_07585 [Streptomyces globisporus]|nr:hypothetical protein [Streptomyces globisporus]
MIQASRSISMYRSSTPRPQPVEVTHGALRERQAFSGGELGESAAGVLLLPDRGAEGIVDLLDAVGEVPRVGVEQSLHPVQGNADVCEGADLDQSYDRESVVCRRSNDGLLAPNS